MFSNFVYEIFIIDEKRRENEKDLSSKTGDLSSYFGDLSSVYPHGFTLKTAFMRINI